MSDPLRVEILPVEVGSETRYGVMEVRRYKTGLGYVVFYGNQSQGGNQHDWGTTAEETQNMRVMAGALLIQIASGLPHG